MAMAWLLPDRAPRLPVELLILILEYADQKTQLVFGGTCRRLRELAVKRALVQPVYLLSPAAVRSLLALLQQNPKARRPLVWALEVALPVFDDPEEVGSLARTLQCLTNLNALVLLQPERAMASCPDLIPALGSLESITHLRIEGASTASFALLQTMRSPLEVLEVVCGGESVSESSTSTSIPASFSIRTHLGPHARTLREVSVTFGGDVPWLSADPGERSDRTPDSDLTLFPSVRRLRLPSRAATTTKDHLMRAFPNLHVLEISPGPADPNISPPRPSADGWPAHLRTTRRRNKRKTEEHAHRVAAGHAPPAWTALALVRGALPDLYALGNTCRAPALELELLGRVRCPGPARHVPAVVADACPSHLRLHLKGAHKLGGALRRAQAELACVTHLTARITVKERCPADTDDFYRSQLAEVIRGFVDCTHAYFDLEADWENDTISRFLSEIDLTHLVKYFAADNNRLRFLSLRSAGDVVGCWEIDRSSVSQSGEGPIYVEPLSLKEGRAVLHAERMLSELYSF